MPPQIDNRTERESNCDPILAKNVFLETGIPNAQSQNSANIKMVPPISTEVNFQIA